MTDHEVQPDGYCFTCGRVPCSATRGGAAPMSNGALVRIEAKLNRLLRHFQIDPDAQ